MSEEINNTNVNISPRYSLKNPSRSVRVSIDLTINRFESNWQRWNANTDYSDALSHRNIQALDTGAITQALDAQFSDLATGGALSGHIPGQVLDMYFGANRQIQILQAVEQELFQAFVINAGNMTLADQKLNAYKQWRDRGIENGLIQIVDDGHNVISRPDTKWLLGGQETVIPPFPESLPGKLPKGYADKKLYTYSTERESNKAFNKSTVIVSTDRREYFDRNSAEYSALSSNTLNPLDFFVSSVVTGSFSPIQMGFAMETMLGGGMSEQWQSLSNDEFDVFIPLEDGNKKEVGYYGINPNGESEIYLKDAGSSSNFLDVFGANSGTRIRIEPDQRVGFRTDDNGTLFAIIEEINPVSRAKRVARVIVNGAEQVLMIDGNEVQADAYEDPYSLIEELNPDIRCFVAGTLIELADGSVIPIEEIRIGDEVFAYDVTDLGGKGALSPRRVTRTYATPDKLVIDFHGLKVTPGHVFLCGDGEHAGQHQMLMEILRADGTIVHADGTVLRAATNAPVGTPEDAFVQVAYLTDANDALMQSGHMRAGTLILTAEGKTKSVLQCMVEEGYRFDTESGLISKDGEEPHPLYWFGEIPRPEDYVLKRSDLTDADLYAEPDYRPEVATAQSQTWTGIYAC